MDIRGVDAAQEKEIVMWFKRSLEERLDTLEQRLDTHTSQLTGLLYPPTPPGDAMSRLEREAWSTADARTVAKALRSWAGHPNSSARTQARLERAAFLLEQAALDEIVRLGT